MYTLGTSSSNFRSLDGKELTRFFTVEIFLFREITSLQTRVYASWVIRRKLHELRFFCFFRLFLVYSRVLIRASKSHDPYPLPLPFSFRFSSAWLAITRGYTYSSKYRIARFVQIFYLYGTNRRAIAKCYTKLHFLRFYMSPDSCHILSNNF